MLILLSSILFAQELPSNDVNEPEIDDSQERIASLEEQLLALQEKSIVSQTEKLLLQQQIQYLSVVIDTRHSVEQRQSAIQDLNKIASSNTLPFYWSLMCSSDELTQVMLDGLHQFEYSTEVYSVVNKGLTCYGVQSTEHAIKSISVMGQLQQQELADVLWNTVSDPSFSKEIRTAAMSTLETQYIAYLQERGTPVEAQVTSGLANSLVAGATGIAGSVFLGSVGTWGQTDVGIGIGYTGGAIMGAAGGWLYSAKENPTEGQALLFSSSVAWGLTESIMLSQSLDLNDNWSAFANTLGTLGGAGYGYWARNNEVSSADVIEMNFMGYWGAQMAVGLSDVTGLSLDEIVYDDNYEIEFDYEAYDEARDELSRTRIKRAMLGSVVGMTAGKWLIFPWDVREESVAFAGLYASEFAAASLLAVPAYEIEKPEGMVRLAIHGAAAGAFVYDYYHPVSYAQTVFGAYGSGAGHLIGAGLPFLLALDDERVAKGALWTGLLGTIAGTAVGNKMQFNSSDWVMTGIGLPLAGWHLGSWASIAQENGWFQRDEYDQAPGFVMTGMGLASIGLGYAGYKYDLSANDSLFLGSSTVWGACYGGLIPLAFGFDDNITGTQHLMLSLVASDVFLGVGSYMISPKMGFDSRRAAIPQLLGLTGATVASLGTFLFTDTEQAFGLSALGGATAGLLGGALLEKNRSSKNTSAFLQNYSVPDIGLQFQFAPQINPDGSMGMWLGIHN
jgi:hypothetical protein